MIQSGIKVAKSLWIAERAQWPRILQVMSLYHSHELHQVAHVNLETL